MNKIIIRTAILAGAVYAIAGAATPAAAQATRTWVSGVGDDVNPCSRTAPCKTFAGAISKTAIGGEINCLDPGGYGAVTINKSLTIDCHYTEGGALAGGNGITVNDSLSATPGTAVVFLRGLDIFGVNPPSNGVRFITGAALHIEDSVIRRFNATNSSGVSFAPTGAAKLYISNSTIADNSVSSTGAGIEVAPVAGGGNAKVVLTNVRIRNNASDGVRLKSANGPVTVLIENCDISGNIQGVAALGGANALQVMISNSQIANNNVIGLIANSNAVVRVFSTSITGNAQGINAIAPSQILSYGANRVNGNPVGGSLNEAFSGLVATK
jgi:hypothetical protein